VAVSHPKVGTLPLPLNASDWLSTEIYRGFYERNEARVIPVLVPEGGTVIDIGAHSGYYTALLSTLVGPTGKVLAFEPSAPRLEDLRQTIAHLSAKNVVVCPVALGAAAETMVLHNVEASHSGLATLRPTAEAKGSDVEVPVQRLDQVAEFQALGSTTIDFLKLDVEGFEPEVLRGGVSDLFDTLRIRHALIEVSPNFGPIEWARDLLLRNRSEYRAFVIGDRGRAVIKPRLQPLGAEAVLSRQAQFNMLVSRVDSIAPLAKLVATA
jgi:FkbM family methyltransferase